MHSHLLSGARAIAHSFSRGAAAPVQPMRQEPIPYADWPAWAKDLATDRQPTDAGIGDTAVHVIGARASKKFQEWYLKIIGQSCGCSDRQAWLNEIFPYPPQPACRPPATAPPAT